MNKHYAAAGIDMSEGQADMAQAEAILALAYEQRTANLITILGGPDIPLFTKDKNIDERYLPMMTELRERLGYLK